MKSTFRTFRISIAAAILLGGGLATMRGQEASRTVEQIYQIDERGDAEIEFNFQLSASMWAQWKEQFGDHPDMMLRDLKYQLAASVIDDFKLEKDDVHRSAVAKIKARCLAHYRGDGQFDIQVAKNMKLVAGSGTEWAFTNSTLENGGIVNITYRGKLPAKAKNAHMVNGNDFNRLVYTLEVAPSKPKTMLYLGIALIVVAIVLVVLAGLFGRRTAVYAPPLPPSTPPTALPGR